MKNWNFVENSQWMNKPFLNDWGVAELFGNMSNSVGLFPDPTFIALFQMIKKCEMKGGEF